MAQAGSTTYAYDCNGNLTSGAGRIITWDFENRPSTIQHVSGNETYTYDAGGERVTKVKGSTTTYYLGALWEEDSSGATKSYYSFNGQVVAMRQASGVTYLHGDHLGSVSVATNGSGAVVSQQAFDPWGKVRSSSSIAQTELNYTGQRLDMTGLLYYHARYYDPALARFISPDTKAPDQANPQDLNLYSYVHNNPIRNTDPDGHDVWDALKNMYEVAAGAGETIVSSFAPPTNPITGQYASNPLEAGAIAGWELGNAIASGQVAEQVASIGRGAELLRNDPGRAAQILVDTHVRLAMPWGMGWSSPWQLKG